MQLLATLALLVSGNAVGQAPPGATPAASATNWAPPRTPDGHPDLQGIWTNATVTPLERPPQLAGKEFFTEAEAAEFEKRAATANDSDRRGATPAVDLQFAYNNNWYDWGSKVVKTRRTSIIVDPPDGRLPPLTPQAQQNLRARQQAQSQPPAGPEDIGLAERCILFPTAALPMLSYAYNNNYRIVQTRDYVAILIEMVHDVRIIPLDGRGPLPAAVRQWKGASRGHWEGNTLVVDTANFNGKSRFGFFAGGPTSVNARIVERFTRTDSDTILYQFTVDDPAVYTKPFSGELTMSKTEGPMFEYACHEGNYGMTGMLSGARTDEKKAARKGARQQKL
jgi:hypothetical protein